MDDEGAVCRFWNWRDGQRTMITPETRNAIAIIESVDPARHDALVEALGVLEYWVEKLEIGKVSKKTILHRESLCLMINFEI